MTRAMRWCGRQSLLMLALAGCSPGTIPFARLEGVLVDVQPEPRVVDEPDDVSRMQINRGGATQPAVRGMSLLRGDTLVTRAGGIGVVTLAAGYQIILEPFTRIAIENPSIFVRIGRIIVKQVRAVREALTVRTEIAAAVVEGTEFIIEVNQQQEMQITVLDGRVRVSPLSGATWNTTIVYQAGERGAADPSRLTRLAPLEPPAASTLQRRITVIERNVRLSLPQGSRFSVTPTIGMHVPTEPLFRDTIIVNDLPQEVAFKTDVAPALGMRLGWRIGPRFGFDASGSYVPTQLRFEGLQTDAVLSANYFYGTGRVSFAVVPWTRPVWFALNGGVTVINRGGEAFAGSEPGVEVDRTDLGGVLGATVGASVGRLLSVYLGADTYFYGIPSLSTPGAENPSQRDLHLFLGLRIPLGR